MASLFNILMNVALIYAGLVLHYDIKSIGVLLAFIAVYAIKALIMPLVLAVHQNVIHGKVIFHDSVQKRGRTKAINV